MTNAQRCFTFVQFLSCATVLHAQGPDLVGYWHNWNDAGAPYLELGQVDPRYTIIEVAFAEPALGTTYDMQFSPAETSQAVFMADVAAQQADGRKVLISMGGANASVHLNSDTERDQFVTSMMGILTTYGFDGLDIDLEGSSVAITGGTIAAPVDASIIRLIDAIGTIMAQYRMQTGQKLFLTMAPETAYVQGGQSAFGGIWGAYLPIIDPLRDSMDVLQVQLYNSGSMYGLDGGVYNQGTADFIVSQTEAVIQGFATPGGFFAGLPPEKVAVGLPACNAAAGGGYVDTITVRAAMEYLLGEGPQPGSYALQQPGGYPTLRGMMTWSINWDAASSCDGAYSYADTYERVFDDLGMVVTESAVQLLRPVENPATDVLRFRSVVNGPVVVHDHTGRAVLRGAMNGGELDVSALPNGCYVLTVQHRGGSARARFVKA